MALEAVRIASTDQTAEWRSEVLPPFDPGSVREHGADAHWVVLEDARRVVARSSLWWNRTPALPGEKVGVLGHWAAAGADAAGRLFEEALRDLRTQGCTEAVGPMDGSTWRRYRLVTDRGTEPPFFLEPDNPDEWPGYFGAAGFVPLAEYTSSLVTDLAVEDPRIPAARSRLRETGVRIRPLDPGSFDEDLKRIYEVAVVSFQDNFLYTPLEEREFAAQYRRLLPHVRPELALLAEHEGRSVGFVFGLPDLMEPARGRPVRTVVLKTVAVLPGMRYAGLGGVLVASVHEAARRLGFSRVVHALMHRSNQSQNISRHYGTSMRRYTLYRRTLA